MPLGKLPFKVHHEVTGFSKHAPESHDLPVDQLQERSLHDPCRSMILHFHWANQFNAAIPKKYQNIYHHLSSYTVRVACHISDRIPGSIYVRSQVCIGVRCFYCKDYVQGAHVWDDVQISPSRHLKVELEDMPALSNFRNWHWKTRRLANAHSTECK